MWWVAAALAGETMYVQGSSLNLRAKPAAEAEVLERLSINTPLEVLGQDGTFAEVRTEDGRRGYVVAEFIAAAEVAVADALARAKAAKDPADRLSWAQRAAAIDPTDEVLGELEAAYEATGDAEGAARVQRERRWPHGLMLLAADRPVPQIDLAEEAAPPAGGTPVSAEALRRRFRLSPNEAGWLLLDEGPAMRVSLAGARKIAVPRCEPAGSTVVFVGAPAVFRRTAIAFAREAPASWSADVGAPPVDRAAAQQAADEGLADLGGADSASWVVPSPEGWLVRYAARADAGWTVVDLYVTATGAREIARIPATGAPAKPLAVRDVNGDGDLDVVWHHPDCHRAITSLQGELLVEGAARCCPPR
jgi:hypothetical protein